jgi:hypothetical protein
MDVPINHIDLNGISLIIENGLINTNPRNINRGLVEVADQLERNPEMISHDFHNPILNDIAQGLLVQSKDELVDRIISLTNQEQRLLGVVDSSLSQLRQDMYQRSKISKERARLEKSKPFNYMHDLQRIDMLLCLKPARVFVDTWEPKDGEVFENILVIEFVNAHPIECFVADEDEEGDHFGDQSFRFPEKTFRVQIAPECGVIQIFNDTCSFGSLAHPHAHTGFGICWGDFHYSLLNTLKSRELYRAIQYIEQWLKNYNWDDCYGQLKFFRASLNKWEVVEDGEGVRLYRTKPTEPWLYFEDDAEYEGDDENYNPNIELECDDED